MLNIPGNNLGEGEVRSSTLRGSTIFLHEINMLRRWRLLVCALGFQRGFHNDVKSGP